MGEIYKLTLTYIDIQHVTPCNSNTECSCTMLYMCYHVLINPMRVHIRDPSPLWCPMWYCYLLSRPGCDEDRPQGHPENPKSPVQPSQSGALGTLWYPVCSTNGIQMNWGFFSIKWQFQHWHTRYLIIIGVHHLDGAFYTQVFWAFPGPLCEFLQFYPIFLYFPIFSPVHQRC